MKVALQIWMISMTMEVGKKNKLERSLMMLTLGKMGILYLNKGFGIEIK
jgi:hypothetical protein